MLRNYAYIFWFFKSKMSGYFSLVFAGKKFRKTTNLTSFAKSKILRKWGDSKTATNIQWVLKVVTIHQHATDQAIPTMRSPGNVPQPQVWPVSLIHNTDKMWNINRQRPKSNQSRRWSGCQMPSPSFIVFSGKCPKITYFTYFTKSKCCQSEENQQTVT